jgi:predicted metal-dependent hydrolase
MSEKIQIGDVSILVNRKAVKNVHLSVHLPSGRVTLVAPAATRLEVARAYAISKLGWIRAQQSKLHSQAREAPRRFVERESHYLWGRRHLLTVAYQDIKPSITLDHRRITLTVRPGSDAEKRSDIMHEWHKSLLHQVVPLLIKKMGVQAQGERRTIFPATDENEVEKLQPQGGAYSFEHPACN